MKRLLSVEQYLLVGFIGALFLAIMYPFLQALLLGFFFALLIYPWYEKFVTRTRCPRGLAALLFSLTFIVVVLLPCILVSLSLVNDFTFLVERIRGEAPAWFEEFSNRPWILHLRERVETFVGTSSGFSLRDKAMQAVTVAGTYALDFFATIASRVPRFFLDIGVFLMALFFGLVDGPRLLRLLREALPFEAPTVERLIRTGESICRGVMVGTLVVSVVQGMIVGLGYLICGIPNPLFFGCLTAIFSLIPLVGSAPIGFGGAIYLFVQHDYGWGIAMTVIALSATLADNILKPMALQGSGSLHPFISILSLIGGLALFGFLGIFLGPLVSALAIVVLKVMIEGTKTEAAPQTQKVVR